MNKKLIFGVVLVFLVALVVNNYFQNSSKQLPQREFDSCDQYSGFYSYAWGGGSEECVAHGCDVVRTEEIDDPNAYDDEGFEFKCVGGQPTQAAGNCVKAGCSGQLCISEEDASESGFSTCEFREEYACYQSAACEKQSNGQCGWTMSVELQLCLDNANRPVKY